MRLYYKNNSYPSKLPFRITLSSGNTRTDPSTFTDEEIADAGYEIAPPKPSIIPWGMEVDWDRDAKRWVVVGEYDKRLDSFDWFKENKKIRDALLKESEVTKVRLIEQDADMTEFNQYIDALNNLNLSVPPENIVWPEEP